jgi:hypothetical protein
VKKKKNKETVQYECELCGKIKPHLYAFCACDACDIKLRKHIKYYRKKREKLEKN